MGQLRPVRRTVQALIPRPAVWILLIEDEARLAASVQRGLQEEGYRVDVAADAHAGEAMALANAGSELVRVTVNTETAAAAVPKIVDTLNQFGVRVPIVGADIVELNPARDRDGITATLAAKLVKELAALTLNEQAA